MKNKESRCGWCVGDPLYEQYHDKEWGIPLYDDEKLFEFLILETFQAGLSWITVLRKRENFRKAFDNFTVKKVAGYSSQKIEDLMNDAGIIRNRKKLEASVVNARAFMEIQNEFGSFSNYIWAFVKGKPIQNDLESYKEAPSQTDLSKIISNDLKKRGFKFIGPTVVYAHMQATGMVNDHEISCFRHQELKSS